MSRHDLKLLLFLLAFSLLNAHELDAMTQSEWRLLFVLRAMPDGLAETVFVALHVPLVAALLWLAFYHRPAIATWSRRLICAFGPIHAGLHWNLQDHALYTFHSPLSLTLIYGYGLTGLLYLLLERNTPPRSPAA